MGVEELFDLLGIDVFASPDDHLLDTAGNLAVAVLIHHRQIPGMEPAVGVDHLGGLLRHLVVPFHDHIAPCTEFTLLPRRQGGAVLDVDDLYFGAGQRPAHGGDPQFDGVFGAGLGDTG